jgi:hypothetical protein
MKNKIKKILEAFLLVLNSEIETKNNIYENENTITLLINYCDNVVEIKTTINYYSEENNYYNFCKVYYFNNSKTGNIGKIDLKLLNEAFKLVNVLEGLENENK